MPAFEYRQAQEIQRVVAEHSVRHLFLGKSGAILLGFPDTTQDADGPGGRLQLFREKLVRMRVPL